MRNRIRKQLRIVEPVIKHEHAFELLEIRRIISENREILSLVYDDLIFGLKDPRLGRKGMMTAEQVFFASIVKQMNGYSYEMLAYHLEDSKSYRRFCGFGIADEIPSKSTLQRDFKKIRPKTLEEINKILMRFAAENGIEKGRKIRVDCTVVETNIHKPLDSSLLYDVVRVLARLTYRSIEAFNLAIKFVNHSRRAKKTAHKILNTRGKDKKVRPYEVLLNIASNTIGYAKDAVEKLEVFKSTSEAGHVAGIATEELRKFITLGNKVISQTQRRVLLGEKVPSVEKVVSIFEPHTDIIKKDRRDPCYGHKVALTGGASGLLADLVIWKGNPADTNMAEEMVARQRNVFGRLPRQASFDGGFASKDNLKNIKALGLNDVVFAKKRGLEVSEMTRSTWIYKSLRNFRAGIEGMISFLKRSLGLSRCNWRGFESFKAYAWSSVVTANLLLMARKRLC